MRVSFYSAVIAVLASSAMAVQIECPSQDLPQPMLVSQVEETPSKPGIATKPTPSKDPEHVDNKIQKMKDDLAAAVASMSIIYGAKNEAEQKKQDEKIEALKKESERVALENKLREEKEKQAQQEKQDGKKPSENPDDWVQTHPDRSKIDVLVARQAKVIANQMIIQRKRDKKKALEEKEKKSKAAEAQRKGLVTQVATAVKEAQEKQAKLTADAAAAAAATDAAN